MTWSEIAAIILVLLVIYIVTYNLIMKNKDANNAFNNIGSDCQKLGGYCTTPSEGCAKDYEKFTGLSNCDISTPVCCKPKQNNTQSPECNGKKQGDACGTADLHSVCNQFGKCVTKCEYCATFPNDARVCLNQKNSKGIIIKFDSSFDCGCNKTVCLQKESTGDCIQGFCEQTNPLYCCD